MGKGDAFWRAWERRQEWRKRMADSKTSDNMEVRKALMRRVEAGEITLEAAQKEIRRLKKERP